MIYAIASFFSWAVSASAFSFDHKREVLSGTVNAQTVNAGAVVQAVPTEEETPGISPPCHCLLVVLGRSGDFFILLLPVACPP